jgi:hypothetical protein
MLPILVNVLELGVFGRRIALAIYNNGFSRMLLLLKLNTSTYNMVDENIKL